MFQNSENSFQWAIIALYDEGAELVVVIGVIGWSRAQFYAEASYQLTI